MKKLFIFAGLFVNQVFAQDFKPRILEPISGHYKTLSVLNPKAIPDTTDRLQFPLEGLSPNHSKKLKLKPQYLFLPATAFKIKDYPENSSAQTKAEIEFLKGLEKTRTPEKIAECKVFANVYYNVSSKIGDADWEKMQKNLFHMGRQIEWFNAEKLPKTAEMMRKVWTDATYYFWALKFKYNRTRPYMLDPSLDEIDTGTNFQAYPSGHASASYVAAFIYQELLPEQKALFQKNAYDMGFSREIIGVHFPSDSEAGRVFARQFVNFLLQNEHFKTDLKIAKAEVEQMKMVNKK